jgi:hypothetical protein
MLCANGEQKTPKGETGIFFICNLEENKGNACRFVRWCYQKNKYEASTDKNGKVCIHFYEDTTS